ARAAAAGAGSVGPAVAGAHGETGVEGQNGAGLPAAQYCVGHFVRTVAELLAATKGKAVDGVSDEVALGVVLAEPPLGSRVVDVLVIPVDLRGLAALAVVADVVGHALGEGVVGGEL